MRRLLLVPLAAVLLWSVVPADEGATGPFAPSRLKTASGKRADASAFFEAADCGECHVQQYEEWKGSVHSRAHEDGIYRAFAERAREEEGDALYLFCSACHAPGAVATGEIPGGTASFLSEEGVTCDVCHRAAEVEEVHAGGGGNASIVLAEGETRFGPRRDPAMTPVHESAFSQAHTTATLCSACHSLLHPHNGLVIENTYEEWKASPYAEAGIQCQDCHMRTAAQAAEVARTMEPVVVEGRTTADGEPRADVHAHLFTGANTNRKDVGHGERHAEEARARLRAAATVALELPETAAAGGTAEITVAVTNVGAGHAIPTSITELRQVWIDLRVADAEDADVFRSGAIDGNGRVDPDAVMYHSVLVDEKGEVTYLPWRAVKMVKEKLIGPKETVRETWAVAVPAGTKGPLKVRAVLRYRSAPQDVLDELFGKGRFAVEAVDMAAAEGTLALGS